MPRLRRRNDKRLFGGYVFRDGKSKQEMFGKLSHLWRLPIIVNMKTVKITVMKMARYDDLIARYENPIEHACDLHLGQSFFSENAQRPLGLCDSAWESMRQFVQTLAEGGGNFYDGWMKNERSAMISCNDGFRPVSFLLETVE